MIEMSSMTGGVAARQDPKAVEGAARTTPPERPSPPATEDGGKEPKLDRYDHGNPPEATGRYYLDHDEAGNPKIAVDDPEQREPEPEWCVADTDRVEAELRQLERKQAELEQQLAQAADDPERQRALQAQLAQTNSELQMKSSDSYKREHTEFRSADGPTG